MEQSLKDKLWVEKFRGSTIDDIVLPLSLKNFFKKIIQKKELPNLLLVSNSPGTGKTSVARALCSELDADVLHINTSKTGIDVLRTNVEKFAYGKSLSGSQKVVIFEEFCGATNALQEALRADIEQYTSCRFILTANYVTKIIDPLRSRMQEVMFNFSDLKTRDELYPKIVKRLINILKYEKIEFDQEVIEKLVKTHFPDIRKMVQLLQQYSMEFGVINENIFSYQDIDDEFYDFLLNKQLTKARKYLIDRNMNPEEVYSKLFNNFVLKLPKEKQGQAIITLAQYGSWHNNTVDTELNMVAALLELIAIISN